MKYASTYFKIEYAKTFSHAVSVLSASPDYNLTSLLSSKKVEIQSRYDAHNVDKVTKGQSGHEWLYT